MKSKNAKKWRRRGVILGIGAITGFIALYQGIVTTSYTIETEKLTDEQSFRIVLLTDLHSCIYGGDQGPLIHKILVQKPDAVLLAGDILDDRAPVDGVRLLLAKLMGRVPLYYATGNHEFWTRDIDAVLEVFRDYGVTILDDRWEETTLNGVPVVIAGVSDPVRETFDRGFNARQAMAEGFADLPEDKFCVLMAHRPNWITEYRKYPFDLVLSGHNHGGQFRIPLLLNGLVGPDEGFFPKYPGGKYQHGKLTQIVGRGLSINPKLCRSGR